MNAYNIEKINGTIVASESRSVDVRGVHLCNESDPIDIAIQKAFMAGYAEGTRVAKRVVELGINELYENLRYNAQEEIHIYES